MGISYSSSFFFLWALLPGNLFAKQPPDSIIAQDISRYLREARSIISKRLNFITDPTSVKMKSHQFIDLANRNYERSFGQPFDQKITANIFLTEAITDVFTEATTGAYKNRWLNDLYKKKFLPARFAREVALKVSSKSKGLIVIRLTAPDKFLVNLANEADDWERKAFQKILDASWERNKAYSETFGIQNKKVFRYLLPEYYKRDCLECHGGEEGKRIHKEHIPGTLGGVGGAISIKITRSNKP